MKQLLFFFFLWRQIQIHILGHGLAAHLAPAVASSATIAAVSAASSVALVARAGRRTRPPPRRSVSPVSPSWVIGTLPIPPGELIPLPRWWLGGGGLIRDVEAVLSSGDPSAGEKSLPFMTGFRRHE